MFLIAALKPIVEKKCKTLFFTPLFRGGELRAFKIKPIDKTHFVSLRFRFSGGNKKYYTKERIEGALNSSV